MEISVEAAVAVDLDEETFHACWVEICPELAPDVPGVGEKHDSHTKGFYSHTLLEMGMMR